MNKYIIQEETLTGIADAIRAKTGDTAKMPPTEMPGLIDGLETKAEFKKVKLPPVEKYGAVSYGNGKYVAIASNGLAAYSEDGVNWTQTSLPSTTLNNGVAYGNGVFVAVNYGALMYSTDGITWTKATAPCGDVAFDSVGYANDRFFVGGNGYTLISTNGIDWTQISSGHGVASGKCVFTYDGTYYSCWYINQQYLVHAWSEDCAKWNYEYSSEERIIDGATALCYGGGKYVAFIYNGRVAYSTDGFYWTVNQLPFDEPITSVTYANGVYVGVCTGERYFDIRSTRPNPNSSKAIYSTDGINWCEAELPSAQQWVAVCCGDTGFVAISDRGVAAYSTDGITWTDGELPITSVSINADIIQCFYGKGLYFVHSSDGKTYVSKDAQHWETLTLPSLGTLTDLCYGGNKFVAVFRDNDGVCKTAYSTEPVTYAWWTINETPLPNDRQDGYRLCYGAGKYVAVGSGVAAYSTDGINWTETAMPMTIGRALGYGNGTFVAVNNIGKAVYSTDGINWMETEFPRANPNGHMWRSISHGRNMFVAVGGDAVAYSTDGINWTDNYGVQPAWRTEKAVAYGSGKFVTLGHDYDDATGAPIAETVCAVSADGITWEESIAFPSECWKDVCYGDGKFVAVYNSNMLNGSGCGIAVCDVTKSLK